MRFLIINPNTTEQMTDEIGEQARRYARTDVEIDEVSPSWGPRSIEGHYEEYIAAAATIEMVKERAGGYDGVIIACYGDPGLYAAREISPVPVVGIAEASMLMACTIAHKFSIVTILPRVQPMLEDLVRHNRMEDRCVSIRTTVLSVLDIERDPSLAEREITVEAKLAVEEDHAEAILLGCAGMGPLDKNIEPHVGVPVLDGVACAVKMLEGLVDYGITTSRVAAFKEPEPKEFLPYRERAAT
jgi:allantoin racemase